jgi:hypothetical protein
VDKRHCDTMLRWVVGELADRLVRTTTTFRRRWAPKAHAITAGPMPQPIDRADRSPDIETRWVPTEERSASQVQFVTVTYRAWPVTEAGGPCVAAGGAVTELPRAQVATEGRELRRGRQDGVGNARNFVKAEGMIG